MFYPTVPQFVQPGVGAASPACWYGPDVPDGDASPWVNAPVGSEYIYVVADTFSRKYTKLKADGADNDWSVQQSGVISQTITRAQFTDGGSTSGTKTLTQQIPAGAFVVRAYLQNVTGFTGDTSAVIIVGDGTDTDRYNTGTPSVFTTAAAIDLGAVSGTAIHVTAATVTITITSAADFTNVTAGKLTIVIIYYM